MLKDNHTLSTIITSPKSELEREVTETKKRKEMHDITIISSDGIHIPAVRYLLGVRSEVFQRMLYGHFIEGSSNDIRLYYDSYILHPIIDYCFACTINHDFTNEFNARSIVHIYECAHYLEMIPLQERLVEIIRQYGTSFDININFNWELLCFILDESTHFQIGQKISNVVMELLATNPKKIKQHIKCFGCDAIKYITSYHDIDVNEMELFVLVQSWVKRQNVETKEKIIRTAKECIEMLDLSNINLCDLDGTVKNSGLVNNAVLSQVYARQRSEQEKHCNGKDDETLVSNSTTRYRIIDHYSKTRGKSIIVPRSKRIIPTKFAYHTALSVQLRQRPMVKFLG